MWGAFVCLLVFCAAGCLAQLSNNVTEIGYTMRFSREEYRLVGAAQVTDAEFASMKYMAYIFNLNNNELKGSGVVYTRYWIITPSASVEGMAIGEIMVKFDAREPDISNGNDRMVKQIIANPTCDPVNTLVNCITLLRICPSIGADHVATLAASITPYQTVGVDVDLIGFQDFETQRSLTKALIQALVRGAKKIGETCECDEEANFVSTKHICLAENNVVYAVDNAASYDLKGMVLTNPAHTEVIGFLVTVTTTDVAGEIVLFLKDQQAFLTANAL